MNLFWAVLDNDIESVTQLLATDGADIYENCAYEWTVLTYACSYGYKKIVEILLNHDNSPEYINQQSDDGRTPLLYASKYGNKEIVELLLNHDNSLEHINRQAHDGSTALVHASRYDHKEIVELLLEHGADADILDDKGRSAYNLAKTDEIRGLLLNWEPKGVKRAKGV